MKDVHHGEARDDQSRTTDPLAYYYREPGDKRYEHCRLLSGRPDQTILFSCLASQAHGGCFRDPHPAELETFHRSGSEIRSLHPARRRRDAGRSFPMFGLTAATRIYLYRGVCNIPYQSYGCCEHKWAWADPGLSEYYRTGFKRSLLQRFRYGRIIALCLFMVCLAAFLPRHTQRHKKARTSSSSPREATSWGSGIAPCTWSRPPTC